MIVVKVELWSARTGEKTELARMEIANTSGAGKLRNYMARTLRGRSAKAFLTRFTQRETIVKSWPSERVHIWNLVATALSNMGYGPKDKTPGDDVVEAAILTA